MPTSPGDVEAPAPAPSLRRSVALRDATVFLVLAAITVVLFGITLALFRSFEKHREALGRTWAAQAKAALARKDPAAAVPALRAALSYTPDDRANQLLLAEALAGSGHQSQATSYFLNLWATRPGDGFVNLQLARLARGRGDATSAVEYYRAAIFGDWGGAGVVRRRECRLEFASYLIERGEFPAARTELLTAASNAPESAAVLLPIGEHLAAARDLPSALGIFERALVAEPENSDTLIRAVATALASGAYAKAEELFTHAQREEHRSASRSSNPEAGSAADVNFNMAEALASEAARLNDLSLTRELPATTRARHLLTASEIAQSRLRACSSAARPPAGPLPATPADPALTSLNTRWKASARDLRRRAAAGNADAQDSLANLIFETEIAAALPATAAPANAASGPAACGPPAGDDLLLLLLAREQGHATLPPIPAIAARDSRLHALATGQDDPDSALTPGERHP